MALYLSPVCNDQQFDANGNPLVGGKVYTYLAGTTTPAATYTDSTGSTPQANPIILNSLGLPASPIWLTGGVSYKLVVKTSADVTLRTVDNVSGINDVTSTAQEWNESGFVPTYINATQFSVPGDQTAILQVNRRLRNRVTAGYAYGRISASVFSAGVTTVTMVNDSTTLDSGLSSVAYGFLSYSPSSVPFALYAEAGDNITITKLGNNTSTVYTTGGTSTAYTITPTPAISAYAIGQSFVVNFNAASGASPTLQISGIATPPNLVKENADGTYSNIAANDIPANHRSRVTLISTTQALVERMASFSQFNTAITVSGSPTAVDWTPPSGVKRIDISAVNLSTNGSSPITLRLGAGGVAKTSGYVGSNQLMSNGTTSSGVTLGVGFSLNVVSGATDTFSGRFSLALVDSGTNTWECSALLGMSSSARTQMIGGHVALSGALNLVRVTTEGGTDTIDNGAILNISYWG